ncbi:uncharacterized protein F5891DRAFT_1183575 [Suillus fuscotomentosus]|uniref:Uncharacterized protein n=1 Tax=Suillus fuscotomentosus TaxID=1912939 RepID=A0AAD4HRJ9_9AGAM|nr:uncharacterized protein F5891DRAFT_1183575 [Suillus fuscotomentosus]KAG1904934.1 hypothetical protein F5891DRAFT_1183575 [Suillus fuscotomentosus]
MQEVFPAPCEVILPQPPPITMQGQTQQDLPIRSGEQDTYDFSSLDFPAPSWDPMAGGLFNVMQPANLFIPHESHPPEHNTPPHVPLLPVLNIPATCVIPPTPTNPVMMGNLTMDTQGGPSGAAVVGQRSEDANTAIEKQFDLIDCAINELVVSTGMPTQQVLNLFLKSRGRINNGTNYWNIYGQYFKAYRLCELHGSDSCWDAVTLTIQGEYILNTFDETRIASGPPLTVAQWSQEFTRLTKKVTSLLDLATAKHGFEAALLMCGKVVNQDASIGYIHMTPGAEEFWASRCRADDNTMVGHFKAHVYHLASLAVVEDVYGEGGLKPSKKNIALPGRRTRMPGVIEDDDEVQEVPNNVDWKTLADHIQCIKVGITSMFSDLGGKLTAWSGTFPWKLLPAELAHHWFVMKGYPEDMLMPGEPRVTVARPKGISDFDKRERVILADALRSGRLTIE